MANNIKGITIEIGGDTTGLDKALKGVNSELTSTQRELKEVDKALKLDPKNTELLEQKQRTLAKAVEATSQKLKTLKEAQAQAAEQLGFSSASHLSMQFKRVYGQTPSQWLRSRMEENTPLR